MLTKRMEKNLYGNNRRNIEQVLEVTPHKAAAVQPLSIHHENYQS